jgi:peptidoglycan/xylan/chitin deacetylase (PgdA/CDA1 family)
MPHKNDPPVFFYHEVRAAPMRGADPVMTISPAAFEGHVRWLAEHGFVGVTVSRWLDARAGRGELEGEPVLITFDDGYVGVGEHALPVLLEHGFSATVFVVTHRLGQANDWDSRAVREDHRLLGRDDIRMWSERGVEIGAHTRTHPRLTRLPVADVQAEIEGSYLDLTELLGAPPRAFAYPYGSVDREVRAHVARIFDAAFTVDEVGNSSRTDDYLLCRSGALEADSGSDLALRVRLGWTPRHRLAVQLRNRGRRLTRQLAMRPRAG